MALRQAPDEGTRPHFTLLEVERFKSIANWYHVAILNLVKLHCFKPDPTWIAKHLGIETFQAADAVGRLLAIGLLREGKDGKLRRTSRNLHLKTRESALAVRHFHKQMLSKAAEELDKTALEDFNRRLINGITFACDVSHVKRIKECIDQFQDDIIAITDDCAGESVYQMNIQFFPLTKE